jgi:hypothetical protein
MLSCLCFLLLTLSYALGLHELAVFFFLLCFDGGSS